MTTQEERAAFDLLDQAVQACFELDEQADGVPVDAVLIIGVQHVEDDGARTGHVEIYPRTGAQPSYITRGLIDEAHSLINNEMSTTTNEDDT